MRTIYCTTDTQEAYHHIAKIDPRSMTQADINTLYDIQIMVRSKLANAEGIECKGLY